MRLALLVPIVAAACGQPPADANKCEVGEFQIVAPIGGQHYASNLAVMLRAAELSPEFGDVSFTMIDDTGTPYAATSTTQSPDPQRPFYDWRLDYALAPGRRYELTVSPAETLCNGESAQTVEFFTSSP
jgi:hypothetical protein